MGRKRKIEKQQTPKIQKNAAYLADSKVFWDEGISLHDLLSHLEIFPSISRGEIVDIVFLKIRKIL